MRRLFKRGFVFVAGTVLVVAGLLLSLPMVPGPGLALALLGLALLATEFEWAKRLLAVVKRLASQTTEGLRRRLGHGAPPGPGGAAPAGQEQEREPQEERRP